MDLSRVAYVIGKENIEKLQTAHVAVVGLGGVGSYIAEALARSGVGALTLVDADEVAPSNINRQLPALESTMGRLKAEVIAERIAQINPDCKVTLRSEFYEPGDFDKFFPTQLEFGGDDILPINLSSKRWNLWHLPRSPTGWEKTYQNHRVHRIHCAMLLYSQDLFAQCVLQ